MLDRQELAEEFKVHINTIDKWRKMGMPCIKVGGFVRFDLEEVIAWLKEDK